jgi:hypothetical protein
MKYFVDLRNGIEKVWAARRGAAAAAQTRHQRVGGRGFDPLAAAADGASTTATSPRSSATDRSWDSRNVTLSGEARHPAFVSSSCRIHPHHSRSRRAAVPPASRG